MLPDFNFHGIRADTVMAPQILQHYCNICSKTSPAIYSAFIFSQTFYCNHCGTASAGIRIHSPTPEPTPKLEAADSFASNMSIDQAQDQDELARLFNANLNLGGTVARPASMPVQVQPPFNAPPTPPQPEGMREPPPPKPVYYASAHYTHSAHVKPRSNAQVLAALEAAGIDPHGLSQEQVNLLLTCPDVEFHQLLLSSPANANQQHQQQMQLTSPAPPLFSLPDLDGAHDGQSVSTMDTDPEHLSARLSPPPRPVSSPGVLYVEAAEPYMSQGYGDRMPPELGYCTSSGQYARRNFSAAATDPVYLGPSGAMPASVAGGDDMNMDM